MAFARRPDGRSRPSDALARFGVEPAAISAIASGRNAWHWRVRAIDGARLVLRRCNPFRTAGSIRYEHGVLDVLAKAGWPVAAALPSPDGATLVRVTGELYALFPLLPGRPSHNDSPQRARERGMLLARLHEATGGLVGNGQRADWCPLLDYAEHRLPPDGARWSETFPALEAAHPELSSVLRAAHDEVKRTASGVELPTTVVHGDLSPWNLLFLGGELTGVIDFDFTHLDARIADIAVAQLFCDGNDARDAVVDGYASVASLTATEFDLLPVARRARHLGHAAYALSFWASGRDDMLDELELAVSLLRRDGTFA